MFFPPTGFAVALFDLCYSWFSHAKAHILKTISEPFRSICLQVHHLSQDERRMAAKFGVSKKRFLMEISSNYF